MHPHDTTGGGRPVFAIGMFLITVHFTAQISIANTGTLSTPQASNSQKSDKHRPEPLHQPNTPKTSPPTSKAPIPATPPEKETWTDRYLWNPISGTILAVIATVIGTIVYDRVRRRVTISLLVKQKRAVVEDVHSLYLQRIDATDRVSPIYVTACLDTPELCIKNPRQFRSMARRNKLPPVMHVLITAKAHGELVGILKATYVRSVRMLFLAYVAVQAAEATLERNAFCKLLSRVRELTHPPDAVDWIVFELTTSDSAGAKAKARLFRQHAKTFKIDIKRIAVEYLQPDLDGRVSGSEEEPAHLYIGATQKQVKDLDIVFVRQVLEGILLQIYFPCWLLDHDPQEKAALETYARELIDLILQKAPTKVTLL